MLFTFQPQVKSDLDVGAVIACVLFLELVILYMIHRIKLTRRYGFALVPMYFYNLVMRCLYIQLLLAL